MCVRQCVKVVLLRISPSSHLNSHSSHLSGRLLLWINLFPARELLWVQQYSHSSHLYGRLPLWEGLDSNQYSRSSHLYGRSPVWKGLDPNLWPSKSRSMSQSTVFAMTHSMANVKIYKHHFFTFFIFAKVWPVRLKIAARQGQTRTKTDKPIISYRRNLTDLLKKILIE